MTNEDRRVTCKTCRHYHPQAHQCGNHKAAGLFRGDVAPAFAALRQWCPGWGVKDSQGGVKPIDSEKPIAKSYHDRHALSARLKADRKIQ